MLDLYRADLRRHFNGRYSAGEIFRSFFEMSLWAIAIFRFGKAVQRARPKLLFFPAKFLYFVSYKLCEVISGIRISAESEIGPGLLIHNFGGIHIRGVLGSDCTFVQGAQMISRANDRGEGWPTLGDRVYAGAGCKIVGGIRVGNDVQIGANAVVMADVPDRSIVMPPQSTILKGFRRVSRPGASKPAGESASGENEAP